jgi:hypothetical protein
MSGSLALWTGRVLTSLFALFMVGASIGPKLAGAQVARDAMVRLGWDARFIPLIGFIELSCLVLHLYPRTSILGSVLMTGLLGGSIAAQLRADQPLFSHVLFGVYIGAAMWGGLWLRDPGLRGFLPLRGI